MSVTSNTISLAGDTPARAGSAPSRPAGLLGKSWQRLAAVASSAGTCLQEAIYLSHATGRADLDRRIQLLERAAHDRNF